MQSEDDKLGFGTWALISLVLLLLLLFGFVFASQFRGWVGAFGIGGLIFLSAATVGALLGFIFAVPRVSAREGAEVVSDGGAHKVLSTNTNLERISDWLTTMLVGVGLSQLTNLDGVFFRFRTFLAEAATVYDEGGKATAGVLPAVGPFILVLGAASGFLFMYLLTRLVLVGFFRKSEDLLSGRAVAAIRNAVAKAQASPEASESEDGTDPTGTSEPKMEPPSAKDKPSDVSNPVTEATLLRASQATTLSNEDALEVMFELLYKAGGYRRVIQMAGELSRTAISKRAEYWFYLAAAFGQQMHHTPENSEERLSARDNALDAARRAVRIDRSFRDRLWAISNPDGPDNDLSLLRDDEKFRQLVGR
ncbi:MAG TPA: hypothetical protein VEA60_03410 [Allosphingosinicella sp.]|nr:hypothetical protein [Allosphingosinicella sp.]